MLALIDGDIAAYRAAAATQKSFSFDPDEEPSIYANPKEAIEVVMHTIRLWKETAGAKDVLVMLTGKANFRKSVYPLYKSNRANTARPVALTQVHEAIRNNFKTAQVEGLEADDLLGMMLTAPKATGRTICVSTDKDLRTVPGLHLNPAKDKQPVFVMEADANRWWMTQALIGDTCDGYPGCPGIGPVKAAKALEVWDGTNPTEGWGLVCAAYRDKFIRDYGESEWITENSLKVYTEAMAQVRVARILRHGDYDKAKKEVILWTPKGMPQDRLAI